MQKIISIKRCLVFFVFVSLFCPVPVFAVFSPIGVPDSSDIRATLVETWFEAPFEMVRENPAKIIAARDKNIFEIRAEENEEIFAIVIAPQTQETFNVYTSGGMKKEMHDMYFADSPGGWVLVRSKKTGLPVSVRFYFCSDSSVFVEMKPDSRDVSRTNASFIVYNMYAARDMPLHIPFSRVYGASLSDLMTWTRRTLPWDYADIHSDLYHSILQMVAVIREALPELKYKHDLMLDERGNQILISTGEPYTEESYIAANQEYIAVNGYEDDDDENKIKLSSGGFVKWICDGLVTPIAGGGLFRKPLIERTVNHRTTSFQGVLSEIYNLSFALDWTRHLASAVRSVESNHELHYPDSGVDVSIEPFSTEITEQGLRRATGYMSNTGHAVRELASLLYVLAITDPGKWYLGALQEIDRSVTPEVHVFNNCVAFFPYIDSDGKFQCAVFANCDEIDLMRFVSVYKENFIHLSRVNSSDFFFPERFSDMAYGGVR